MAWRSGFQIRSRSKQPMAARALLVAVGAVCVLCGFFGRTASATTITYYDLGSSARRTIQVKSVSDEDLASVRRSLTGNVLRMRNVCIDMQSRVAVCASHLHHTSAEAREGANQPDFISNHTLPSARRYIQAAEAYLSMDRAMKAELEKLRIVDEEARGRAQRSVLELARTVVAERAQQQVVALSPVQPLDRSRRSSDLSESASPSPVGVGRYVSAPPSFGLRMPRDSAIAKSPSTGSEESHKRGRRKSRPYESLMSKIDGLAPDGSKKRRRRGSAGESASSSGSSVTQMADKPDFERLGQSALFAFVLPGISQPSAVSVAQPSAARRDDFPSLDLNMHAGSTAVVADSQAPLPFELPRLTDPPDPSRVAEIQASLDAALLGSPREEYDGQRFSPDQSATIESFFSDRIGDTAEEKQAASDPSQQTVAAEQVRHDQPPQTH